MREIISFKKELDDLQTTGLTEAQTNAIYKLTLRMCIEIASRCYMYGGAELGNNTEPQTDVCDRPKMDCENCWKRLHCRAKDEPQRECDTCKTYWNCQGQCDEVPQIEDKPQMEGASNECL